MANLIDKNTVTLLRIPFSFLLMPLFLLALSQSGVNILNFNVIVSFLIIHLLVYPASNGYNSYVDQDEGSIGGIENPPLPTIQLFYVTVFLDILALILSVVCIHWKFAICIFLYILASRAYSSKTIRLKKYPYIGFLTVVFFQGAFTYYMCVLGITGQLLELNQPIIYLLIACSLQIAGAYPLTQIYQHQQDYKDGVITISYKLGYIGTFLFTGIMFLGTNLFYFLYFNATESLSSFYILQLFFLPIVGYYVYWFSTVIKDRTAANFKHTMRMNLLAAICMNTCFLILYIMNTFA
ncbi:UbiA family prenyltransferase [uncultured Cytophaga sp.]|uniref:UbiA family prenyltransferase n=1 Tax=uncultured Cytophaga sp. TaxID=160238 RepID=UPI00262064F6|nr:UbiA family prenyltransferase [uncultured Cytophaga sp.]